MTGFYRQNLSQLFSATPVRVISPEQLPDIPVMGIALDSRLVQPGFVFFALVGEHADGHRYISEAVKRGAVAAVGTQALTDLPIPYVQVEDARFALAHFAAAFYRFPARRMTVIGVTGTDGKTTTANLIYKILLAAGLRAGIISTVNAVIGDEVLDTGFHVTTPEAPEVQRYLARMLAAGLTHVVLEATSHGLVQHRVSACEFDIAVVTNVTHEHLDYHGTYERYLEAKARLFTGLSDTEAKPFGNPRMAVLNKDDQSYAYLNRVTTGLSWSYSLTKGSDLWAEDIHYDASGLHFMATSERIRFPVSSSLVGKHNVSNILAALGATWAGLGIPVEVAQQGILSLQAIPGRMEWIDMGQSFIAIVDFAHTPNALQRALEAARSLTDKRVIAVFGSAGLRDREKRRMMPQISAKLADISVLTAEDPRTESLDDILEEMAQAARQAGAVEGKNLWRVADRGEAIRLAVRMAQPGDVVIACGKGHEQSMCFGTREYAWDDRVAMRACLAELLGVPGPDIPHLPTAKPHR